jgi:predicted PurR-regulated permease PerM
LDKPGWLLSGAIGAALAWLLRDVLLLVFAVVLLAVFLCRTAALLQARLRLPWALALATVLFALAGAFVVVGLWQGPRISDEVEALRRDLPAAFDHLRARLSRSDAVRQVANEVPSPQEIVGDGTEFLARARSLATITTGALAAFGLWIFLAVLLSATPGTYVRGVLALVPTRREPAARQLLEALGQTQGGGRSAGCCPWRSSASRRPWASPCSGYRSRSCWG